MMQEDQIQRVESDDQISVSSYINKDTELLKWQLSGADLIDEIKNRLRGFTKDEEKNEWIKECEPLLNDQGISNIIAILNSYGINKNTILSTLEESMVYKMMKDLDKDIAVVFVIKHDDFAIPMENMTVVKNACCHQVYFAMTRAINGAEKKFLTSTERRTYNYNPQQESQQQKKGGFFGFLGR